MGIENISKKLDKYFRRLERGKAAEIKPAHVEKAIEKLNAKQKILNEELGEAKKPSKKDRLDKKLVTVREQIERAQWLLGKIS